MLRLLIPQDENDGPDGFGPLVDIALNNLRQLRAPAVEGALPSEG
jgi:hypothetical protein